MNTNMQYFCQGVAIGLAISIGIPASADVIDFGSFGNMTTNGIIGDNVYITGSHSLTLTATQGGSIFSAPGFLGVSGGTYSNRVDTNEYVNFEFTHGAVQDVFLGGVYEVPAGTPRTVAVEGFGANGASLGLVSYTMPSYTLDVSSLYSGQLLSRFQISPDAVSIGIGSLAFTPVPLPPAAWLFGAGLLVLLKRRSVSGQRFITLE